MLSEFELSSTFILIWPQTLMHSHWLSCALYVWTLIHSISFGLKPSCTLIDSCALRVGTPIHYRSYLASNSHSWSCSLRVRTRIHSHSCLLKVINYCQLARTSSHQMCGHESSAAAALIQHPIRHRWYLHYQSRSIAILVKHFAYSFLKKTFGGQCQYDFRWLFYILETDLKYFKVLMLPYLNINVYNVKQVLNQFLP